ncbi:uncharacterized protein LOC130726560 [Lotus japonicus]|uniref:uncharacterized protein LOC130726560 n=1 Tax=Lotus japonicus TaxID=34305 RepID=UPI00258852B3|nr:uncharacterized protein LOC130726560 [Lotus japonicus]
MVFYDAEMKFHDSFHRVWLLTSRRNSSTTINSSTRSILKASTPRFMKTFGLSSDMECVNSSVCGHGSKDSHSERVILAPTLESVEHVNNYMLSKLPGVEREYLSYDTPCRSDEDSEVHAEWFTSEFLNDVQCSGIPNHRLILKVGVLIMLLRNIDQAAGLCNGTRFRVTHLTQYIIVATVLSGIRLGKNEYIPRITLTPSDSGLPFKFSRRQFPVTLCFAMTINKNQGQSLSHVGFYLPRPVFTHGQLYVALSRVKSRKGLKVLIVDEQGVVSSSTRNVVYKEVFENV